jgi:hypothetical protein
LIVEELLQEESAVTPGAQSGPAVNWPVAATAGADAAPAIEAAMTAATAPSRRRDRMARAGRVSALLAPLWASKRFGDNWFLCFERADARGGGAFPAVGQEGAADGGVLRATRDFGYGVTTTVVALDRPPSNG